MPLRICFENMDTVNVNDATMMRHYAESYLDDFKPEWAGFIMLPHEETARKRMEPVWQMMLRTATPDTEERLLRYLRSNPMAAYHVHVYRGEGTGAVKLFGPETEETVSAPQ